MTSGQAHDQRRQLSGDKVVLENLNIGAFLEARAPSAFQDSGQNTVGETAGSTLICFEPSKIPYTLEVGSGLFSILHRYSPIEFLMWDNVWDFLFIK